MSVAHIHKNYDYKKSARKIHMANEIWRGNWALYGNLAHVYNMSEDFENAYKVALQGLDFGGIQSSNFCYNLGVISGNLRKLDESIQYYRKALEIGGDYKHLARYNLGLALLLRGDFDEGWKNYEARFDAFSQTKEIRDRFTQKVWTGKESLKKKSIYVYSEQGIGDLFNFARYLPLLKKKGAKIILEPQLEGASVLKHLADEIVPRTNIWPTPIPTDFVISVNSLPGIFEARPGKIPLKPYMFSTKEIDLPEHKGKFKIGICWAGGQNYKNDLRRSCHLKLFAPLAKIPNVSLFGLIHKSCGNLRQWNGKVINLIENVEGMPIHFLHEAIEDFNDTAAFINTFDITITVDTAVAHLAGAMGKKAWVMIDYLNDWRWGREGNTSYWYPSLRLFRQTKFQDWSNVIEDMVKEVNKLLANSSSERLVRNSR